MTNQHAEIINALRKQGVLVSHYMNYWTLEELLRYYRKHT